MIKEKVWVPYYNSILDGMFFFPEDSQEKHPVVCKVHGLVSTDFEKDELLAEILTDEGIAYFVFHFSGFSSSPGETSIHTSLSNLDNVISFLTNHPKIDPLKIGIYAISLGAAISICHIARDPRVSALALQTPLHDFNFMVNYPEFNALWQGLSLTGMVRLPENGVKEQLIHDIQGNNPLECIRKITPRPLIILAGEKDSFIPINGIKELYRRAKEPKQFEILIDADHNLSNKNARNDAYRKIRNFFMKNFIGEIITEYKICKPIYAT
ncbi:MAG: lysophospholipase [Asgard group archaeon]|nr:lysophospholipase [Asgard group archaeon]